MEERFLQDLEEQQTTCKYMIKKTVQTKNSPANRPRQPPAAIQHQGQGLGNILKFAKKVIKNPLVKKLGRVALNTLPVQSGLKQN